jgi:hypothetical protein
MITFDILKKLRWKQSWLMTGSYPTLRTDALRKSTKSHITTVGVPSEIRTGHIKDTKQKHYRLSQWMSFRQRGLWFQKSVIKSTSYEKYLEIQVSSSSPCPAYVSSPKLRIIFQRERVSYEIDPRAWANREGRGGASLVSNKINVTNAYYTMGWVWEIWPKSQYNITWNRQASVENGPMISSIIRSNEQVVWWCN